MFQWKGCKNQIIIPFLIVSFNFSQQNTNYPMRVSLAAWEINNSKQEKPYMEMKDLLVCNEDEEFHKQKYTLVGCTHLTDNMINRLPEWLEYHRLIGFDHFMIYVDSPNVDIYRKILEKYMQRHPNLVTFVPFFFVNNRRAELPGQGDCIYRLKGISEMAGVFDVDEFFYLLDNSTNLPQMVRKIVNKIPKYAGVYGNSFLHSTTTGEYPDSSRLFMENFILRMSTKAITKRDKGVVLIDRTNYVGNHNTAGGERSLVVNNTNEFRVNHFRYPALENEWLEPNIVQDTSMRDQFSAQVKLELQRSGIALK